MLVCFEIKSRTHSIVPKRTKSCILASPTLYKSTKQSYNFRTQSPNSPASQNRSPVMGLAQQESWWVPHRARASIAAQGLQRCSLNNTPVRTTFVESGSPTTYTPTTLSCSLLHPDPRREKLPQSIDLGELRSKQS